MESSSVLLDGESLYFFLFGDVLRLDLRVFLYSFYIGVFCLPSGILNKPEPIPARID